MDGPARVGLVFPRSGQQLYVHLPASAWQDAEARVLLSQQDRPVVKELSSWSAQFPFNEDGSQRK
jgi:hypothetical protein